MLFSIPFRNKNPVTVIFEHQGKTSQEFAFAFVLVCLSSGKLI